MSQDSLYDIEILKFNLQNHLNHHNNLIAINERVINKLNTYQNLNSKYKEPYVKLHQVLIELNFPLTINLFKFQEFLDQ